MQKIEQPGTKIERRLDGLPYPLWWEHERETGCLCLYRMCENGNRRGYGHVLLTDPQGYKVTEKTPSTMALYSGQYFDTPTVSDERA